jgi:putative sterol carrier protein
MPALLEMINEAGYHLIDRPQTEGKAIVLWNNHAAQGMRFHLAGLDVNNQGKVIKGELPDFALLLLDENEVTWQQGRQLGQGRVSLDSWLEALPDRVGDLAEGQKMALGLGVLGESGRAATLILQEGHAWLEEGLQDDVSAAIKATRDDWLALINGEVKPEELFAQGKLELQGSVVLLQKLAAAFDVVQPGKFSSDSWRLKFDYEDLLHLQLDSSTDWAKE